MTLDGFFCFSLHTGAVLLGWLGFVSAFFSIIGWSMSFNNIDGFIKVRSDKIRNEGQSMIMNIFYFRI